VSERFLIMQDIPTFIYEQRGIRISLSSLEKLCSPAVNEGPPLASYCRRPLRRCGSIV
jgi:hypothetical protein